MSTVFKTINPKNGKLYRSFEAISNLNLENSLSRAWKSFNKPQSLQKRFEKMSLLAQILSERRNEYAEVMTLEMGKPIV